MTRRAAVIALGLVGCGPALPGLLTQRHYREAICAAHEGSDAAREAVGRALDADAAIGVNVHFATDDELRAALGDGAERLKARARIARVVAQSDSLPIDGLTLSADVVTDEGRRAAMPAGWETLAWATRETLPPQRRGETWLTGENVLVGGAAVFTLGFSLLFAGFHPRPVMEDAPLSEYARLAPWATQLRSATESAGCVRHALAPDANAGARCTWFFVVDNTTQDPLWLELTARYESLRVGTDQHHPERCTVERRTRLPLGAPPQLRGSPTGALTPLSR